MSARHEKLVPDQDKDGTAPPRPTAKLSAAQQAWLEENREAIEEYNRWMEAGNDPFAELRRP